MLLAALALPLLALLGLALRARLLVVLALIAAYVPLAGAGPSIQRAGVMGAAGLVAGLAGRPSSRWYALLLAAGLTLAINPRAAADPGWQLSFAAVVGILALAARVRDALVARRSPAALAEALALTFSATLGTAPLIAFHFGRVSLASLPANLLAAPAVAPIMWLGMIAAAIGELAPAVAAPVNALSGYPLAYMGWLAHATAALPGASVGFRLGSPGAVAGAYVALLLPLVVRHARGPVFVLACGVLTFAAATGARAPPAPPRGLVVSFLDIGQGDATLIQHGAAAVLVDTGPPGGPLLARLRAAGVRRLDVLVVTHAQADHEGEAADVLDHYPVGLLLDGGADAATSEHRQIAAAAARRRVRALTPDAGQVLHVGPIELDVMWPKREPAELHVGQNPNQRAIVARVRDGAFTLLLTADAESDVTEPLSLPPVLALKVAHHGSADPGLPGLLARLHPRIAVISVGRHNPYGHPTAQALAALRAVPQLHRTDRDGTVRLSIAGDRMSVATGN
jgi:competence protein ComEC